MKLSGVTDQLVHLERLTPLPCTSLMKKMQIPAAVNSLQDDHSTRNDEGREEEDSREEKRIRVGRGEEKKYLPKRRGAGGKKEDFKGSSSCQEEPLETSPEPMLTFVLSAGRLRSALIG